VGLGSGLGSGVGWNKRSGSTTLVVWRRGVRLFVEHDNPRRACLHIRRQLDMDLAVLVDLGF
jgi:hypothetical protein